MFLFQCMLKNEKNTKLFWKTRMLRLLALFFPTGVLFESTMGWNVVFFVETTSLQSSAKYGVSPDTYRSRSDWCGHLMRRFSRQVPPLGLYLLLVFFRLRDLYQFLGVLAYHAAAGSGTDGIFTSGVPSPLDDKRRSIAVTFFPLPQMTENRLNHGQKLKISNLRDQESGNVPLKNM